MTALGQSDGVSGGRAREPPRGRHQKIGAGAGRCSLAPNRSADRSRSRPTTSTPLSLDRRGSTQRASPPAEPRSSSTTFTVAGVVSALGSLREANVNDQIHGPTCGPTTRRPGLLASSGSATSSPVSRSQAARAATGPLMRTCPGQLTPAPGRFTGGGAGEWTPARHGAWFAERVIAVKLEYELSVDPRERDALEALLAGGGAQLSCVDADTPSPTVAISSDAGTPVTGPFSITVAFSEPVTGFELEDLVVGNGSGSELQGNNASYMATITPAASGTVTVDIAAGATQDGAGNPSAAAVQFSIVADLTPVPALPVIGALALALLLLGGGARRRTGS